MNGVRDRVQDALLLWESGRREGAFICTLIAVAATARKRYSDQTDRRSFEQFLSDCYPGCLQVEFRGKCQPVEHLLYKWLRCQLVHEAGLPTDIQFMEEEQSGTMSIRAGGQPEYLLKMGTGWFHHLVRCAVDAPENADVTFGPTG